MLHCKNVFKSYNDKTVLKGINLDICEGHIFGLLGPSGAGKTTLIKILTDQLKFDSGEVKVFGKEGMDPFYGAPTVVIVLADKNMPTCVEDGSLVMGNLMNAAYGLGVGSCWIHRAKEEFESEEGKALLKKWGVEGDYIGVGHCILGYAKEEPKQAAPRKEGYVVRV